MAIKERHCWHCGESMGMIESKYWSHGDTCGKRECDRAAQEAEREHREEAHRDLDDRMGW